MAEASRTLRLSVALASAAALAYEIALLRLFSIAQFHHTAYLVISLALLGYGASGTLLASGGAAWAGRREGRFAPSYSISLAAGALAMPFAFSLAQRVTVHPEEMLWDPGQALRLVAVYLSLAVPFFCVGLAVGLALTLHRAGPVYAWDLVGAGLGSLLVVGLLWVLEPQETLRWLASMVAVAAALGLADTVHRRSAVALSVPVLALVWLAPASWLAPRISPYKSLSQALRVEGARLVDVRSSPVSQIAVVESPVVPLRHAPGLSLAAPREPPEQTGLFVDAGGVTAIARELDAESLSYLDYTTAALPYHVAPPSAVLVLGVGGGEGILRAALLGAERIVGVELDPWLARLAGEAYGGFTGEPFPGGGVTLARADIRGWVASGEERFDLVEHVAPGELGGGGPVLASLAEGYLYTTEAIEGYLERVRPSGLLALTTWMKNPPRDHVKLAAAAVGALERLGRAPAERLAAIRGWQTATLLIKPTPFTAAELEALRAFCRARLFDVVYYPGMREEEANRYNRLPEPAAHRALVALLGPERHRFLAAYPFDVAPATDDRPFFHQFFRWRTLPSILESRGRGGLSLLEAGYLVLVVTLLQGLVLGGLLILVPWLALRRETRAGAGEGMARTVVYFGALGLGFLALEIAFLQKLVLLLHHPVYSSAAVLAGFLVFAGLGSAASARLERRFGSRAVALAAACVVAIGLVDLWLLRAVVPALTGHPLVVRVSVALAMIAPLALPMGMLFPLGLARIRRLSERLVPWAWAINGSASVVSPIAATLLAVHLGFSAVVAGALVCYAVAGVVFGRAAVGARENLASG